MKAYIHIYPCHWELIPYAQRLTDGEWSGYFLCFVFLVRRTV